MYDFFDHVYNKRVLSNYEVIIHHLAVSMLKKMDFLLFVNQ